MKKYKRPADWHTNALDELKGFNPKAVVTSHTDSTSTQQMIELHRRCIFCCDGVTL